MAPKVKHDYKELAEIDQQNEVRRLFLSGKSRAAICRELGLSDQTVGSILNDVASAITFEMVELAEMMSGLNLARTEYLLSKSWPYATGDAEDLGGVPDPRMMKIALDIIKLQLDFTEAVQKRKAEADERERRMGMVIDITQTFPQKSELYEIALAHMQQTWMEGGEDPMNTPVEALYNFKELPVPEDHTDERLAKLEERLNKYEHDSSD